MYLLFLLYVSAHADSTIKVKVTQEQTKGNTFGAVIPQAFLDNEDGSMTLELFICGAVVQFTGPKERMLLGPKDKELDAAVNSKINKYCAQFLK